MRKSFMASLCYYGAQGGALYLDESGVRYRSQKISLPKEYRDISILYSQIRKLEYTHSLLVFPAVKIMTKNDIQYKFIVFNMKRFAKHYDILSKQS